MIFLALVGSAPSAIMFAAAVLLISALAGQPWLWRQTDSDFASAVRNYNLVAIKIFLNELPNVDAPIRYSHPRILNSRELQLPPLAIALVHGDKGVVQNLIEAGSDPARALRQLPLETASALLAYAIEMQNPTSVTYLTKYRVDRHHVIAVTLAQGRAELTPLEYAAYIGDRWTIEALLEGADQSILERGLDYLVRNRRDRGVSLILTTPSNDSRPAMRRPPLHRGVDVRRGSGCDRGERALPLRRWRTMASILAPARRSRRSAARSKPIGLTVSRSSLQGRAWNAECRLCERNITAQPRCSSRQEQHGLHA